MKSKWNKFDSSKGGRQKLPPIKRWVLLKLEGMYGNNHALGIRGIMVVGYRKNHAGCQHSPYFIIPGFVDREQIVMYWADVLGDDFEWLADD